MTHDPIESALERDLISRPRRLGPGSQRLISRRGGRNGCFCGLSFRCRPRRRERCGRVPQGIIPRLLLPALSGGAIGRSLFREVHAHPTIIASSIAAASRACPTTDLRQDCQSH
jgi:hypothetical protein